MNTSKYSDAIRSGQLKILVPTLKDLKEAVKKDALNIKSKVAKIKDNLDDNPDDYLDPDDARNYVADINDLRIILGKLDLLVKDFPKIVKEINRIWSHPMQDSQHEDEYRLSEVIEIADFSWGCDDFDNVHDVYEYVGKHMKNTIKYLSKFGCITCGAGDEAEVLAQNHPWAKDIYKIQKANQGNLL